MKKRKKMGCGGKVKKMKSGGKVRKTITAIADAEGPMRRKLYKKYLADKKKGIKYTKPPPTTKSKQRTSSAGTIQIMDAQGNWVDTGRKASQGSLGTPKGGLAGAARANRARKKKKKNR